jgi:predicted hotdog family 3-hydroxylacyl-ACP dehydratase
MPTISKADLSRLIPHQGAMCLLDEVYQWDQVNITCGTASHRDATNPLRRGDRLEAICGLEYAAQAMGVHVGLLEQGRNRRIAVGYMGAVRDLLLRAGRLDDVKGDLTIQATRLTGQADGFIYTFRISAGGQMLLDGRASIFIKYLGQQP